MKLQCISLLFSLCLALSACCLPAEKSESSQPEPPRSQHSTKEHHRGVVLVAHGLNLRPSAMDELCTALNAAGFHTYRISLTGHENERDGIFPAAQWTDDFAAGYRTARTLHPTLPIYIVAFSAGGLLTTQFLDFSEHLDTNPRRMVLLAPALALRPLPRTAYFLRWFGPLKLRVRNLAPSSYRRFDTTPLFWYTNIIDLYDETRILRRPERLRTIPTLIFMSREDELISFLDLETWIEENHLSASWKIEEVQPQPKDSDLYEHLIIDERSLGVEQWRRMVERITSFLIEAES